MKCLTFAITCSLCLAAACATLSLSGASVSEDAVVSVLCADGLSASAVRIGTSATQTRTFLNHFRINAKRINRQTGDGWLNPADPGLIITVK